jgi:hypothetical protein
VTAAAGAHWIVNGPTEEVGISNRPLPRQRISIASFCPAVIEPRSPAEVRLPREVESL